RVLAAAVGAGGDAVAPSAELAKLASLVAADVRGHRGSSVIVAGEHQSPEVHALAHAMNIARGNFKAVAYTDPIDANPINQTDSIKDLVADTRASRVDLLVVLGGNAAYDTPADLDFANILKSGKIPLRVHLGL